MGHSLQNADVPLTVSALACKFPQGGASDSLNRAEEPDRPIVRCEAGAEQPWRCWRRLFTRDIFWVFEDWTALYCIVHDWGGCIAAAIGRLADLLMHFRLVRACAMGLGQDPSIFPTNIG